MPSGIHTFFADSAFYHGENIVQKFGLDKTVCGHKKTKDFLKLGVDFVAQTRYNVCLYGKLEEGGAIHAQH